MTQYEYKVVKGRVVDQSYYTSWLAAYGWQVQNMQEVIDNVVNQSMGFSHNTGSGSMFGNSYFHPHTNTASFSGYQTSHSWGLNMGTNVTQVHTKLTITFFRDVNFPDREELNRIEALWWKCSDRYLAKVIKRGNAEGGEHWPTRMSSGRQKKSQRTCAYRNRPSTSSPRIKCYPVSRYESTGVFAGKQCWNGSNSKKANKTALKIAITNHS